MTLHTESQFKAYKKIPSSRRILHMDATGNMISIPHTMRKYNRILTYALIAQDIDKLSNTHKEEQNYLLLTETSTSSHDTHQLSKMLLNAKICFKSLYPNENFCYMLVLDLSWASIHAACNELNNEDFIDYSNRIFRMASGDNSANNPSKVLLASCASHTMNRFTKAVNKKKVFSKDEQKLKQLGIFSFSLMLNCLDLKSITDIFRLLCLSFNGSGVESENAQQTLVQLIENRPESQLIVSKETIA